MIGFFGYNFLADGNSADPNPTGVSGLNYIQTQNAIFESLEVTSDVTSQYITEIPSEWTFYDIMFANFEGNLNAGNVANVLDKITSIKIKRREYGTFDWITLYEQDVDGKVGNLSFVFEDYFAKADTRYEYAWIPVINGVEGDYMIKDVLSKFAGVFVADKDSIYKFEANVNFDTMQRVQRIGVFEPFGRQYPVYVSNALTNYNNGTFNATLIGDYTSTGKLSRKEMVEERDKVLDFLTNKKPKVIKDYNGNIWLVIVVDNPSVTFDANWGNGIASVSFQWGEIGNAEKEEDLKSAGIAR